MKNIKLLLACLLAVLSCLPCMADEKADYPDFVIKFNYLKQVPASVRVQTPAGFKTLQCGMSAIGERNEKVLLHLYTFPNRAMQNSYFDMFVLRQDQFRRINSVKLPGISAEIDQWSNIVWLDVKTRKVPIVPISVAGKTGGHSGTCRLLIFNHGIRKQPTVQDFEHYLDFASLQVNFDRIDEHGYVVLNHEYWRTSGGPDDAEHEENLFYWNGQKFEKKEVKAAPTKK